MPMFSIYYQRIFLIVVRNTSYSTSEYDVDIVEYFSVIKETSESLIKMQTP